MGNTRKRKPRIVTIKLDAELDDELAYLAQSRNVTRSSVVRAALREYAHGPSKSALDAAGDVVASLAGPGDLSTNKKHLRGFGK